MQGKYYDIVLYVGAAVGVVGESWYKEYSIDKDFALLSSPYKP